MKSLLLLISKCGLQIEGNEPFIEADTSIIENQLAII
jgi:hypothetical protein